jgi:hypothetical protein
LGIAGEEISSKKEEPNNSYCDSDRWSNSPVWSQFEQFSGDGDSAGASEIELRDSISSQRSGELGQAQVLQGDWLFCHLWTEKAQRSNLSQELHVWLILVWSKAMKKIAIVLF